MLACVAKHGLSFALGYFLGRVHLTQGLLRLLKRSLLLYNAFAICMIVIKEAEQVAGF